MLNLDEDFHLIGRDDNTLTIAVVSTDPDATEAELESLGLVSEVAIVADLSGVYPIEAGLNIDEARAILGHYDERVKCGRCQGRGTTSRPTPAGWDDGYTCPRCKGARKLPVWLNVDEPARAWG